MNVNGLPNTAAVAASNFPDESAPPSSGSLSVDLTETRQAATSQSLNTGASDDWMRIREEFDPPDELMHRWERASIRCERYDTKFGEEVGKYQVSLAKTGKEPTLVTTAMAARVHDLDCVSRAHPLTLLLDLNGIRSDVTFDKNKLETLAGSEWIECFQTDERDKVLELIQSLEPAG